MPSLERTICCLLLLGSSLPLYLGKDAGVPNPLDLDVLKGVLGGGGSCKFECPSLGVPPTPKRGHKPESNGCGVEGMHVSFDRFKEMVPCCDAHDFCYDTCNRKKKKCDEDFDTCLQSKCKSHRGSVKEDCLNTGKLMLTGAEMFGCDSFLASQKNACDCKPKREL